MNTLIFKQHITRQKDKPPMMNTSTPSDCKMRNVTSPSQLRFLVLIAALSFARVSMAQLVVTAPSDTLVECGTLTDTATLGAASVTGGCMPWINEFHYDNVGTDAGEFIEIAGPAGLDLTGWLLVRYNGSTPAAATTYTTSACGTLSALSGIIDNEGGSGYGALVFTCLVDGIQNGGNDGFALVDPLGTVRELISYEGVFTASNGPAAGQTSTDIGVAETAATLVGASLHRTGGPGNMASEFTWAVNADDSPGTLNTGQTTTSQVVTLTFSDEVALGICPIINIITRLWSATDNCGNSGTDVQTITVQDTTPPTISCPANVTINPGDPTDPANTGMPSLLGDACSMAVGATSSDVFEENCPAAPDRIIRTWTATDDCGLTTTCVQSIWITCFAAPTGACCLPDGECITVSASECQASGGSYFGDNVSCTAVICPVPCEIICPPNPPIIEWPFGFNIQPVGPDTIQDESVGLTQYGLPMVTGDCGQFQIHFQDQLTMVGNCPDSVWRLDRTWILTASTGLVVQCIQTFWFSDRTDPSVDCVAFTFSVEWGDPIPELPPFVTDNCGTPTVTYSDNNFFTGQCPLALIVTRTWYATDNCDNVSSCTQIINVTDTTPPEITCPPDFTVIDAQSSTDPLDTGGPATATDNCGTPVVTYTDFFDFDNCPFETNKILRHWRATDVCGLVTTCIQEIWIPCEGALVMDCTKPAPFVCVDELLTSGDLIELGYASAEGDCEPITVYVIDSAMVAFGCSQTWTYTFTAIDECGNQADTCAIIVTSFFDDQPPVISCSSPPHLGCNPTAAQIPTAQQLLNGGFVTASDNCGPAIIGQLPPLNQTDGCTRRRIYRFRATDICGQQSPICSVTVSWVVDITPPEISCPADIALQCLTDSIPAPNPSVLTVTDDCALDYVTWISDVNDGLTCPRTIIRTYEAADTCGNVSICTQYIIIDDTTPPVILCPPLLVLECNVDTDPLTLATATDNCGIPIVTYTEVEYPQNCANFEFIDGFDQVITLIVRTFYATDDCENVSSCTQHILIRDDTPPALTCPEDVTIECTDDPNDLVLTGVAIAHDLCDPDAYATILLQRVIFESPCSTVIERFWVATDFCGNGNSGAICPPQLIIILDTTPPSITCPDTISIECGQSLPVAEASATDNCNSIGFTYSDSEPVGSCPMVVTRTHYATDFCGNRSSCTQLILIEDTTPPEISCPAHITIECGDDLPAPSWTVDDICDDNVTVTYVTSAPCALGFTGVYDFANWFISDPNGGSVTTEGTSEVTLTSPNGIACNDTSTLFGIVVPADDTLVFCWSYETVESPIFDPFGYNLNGTFYQLTATAGPSGQHGVATVIVSAGDQFAFEANSTDCVFGSAATVVVGFIDCSTSGDESCEAVVLRTYYAEDECGNVSSCMQCIIIEDTTPPDIVCPEDVTLECNVDTIPTTLATATDICVDVVDVTYSDEEFPQECDNAVFVDGEDQVLLLIVRTHYATDNCGNIASCTQHILIRDDTPPEKTCPDDVTIQCHEDPNDLELVGEPIVYDLCDPDAFATILVTFPLYSDPCSTVLQRVWFVTDHCGNGNSSALCLQRITIVDTTPPVMTCPDDMTIECGDDLPTSLATGTDNCFDVSFTYSDSDPAGACPVVITRTHFATDSCGNIASCTQHITIRDTTPPSITCPAHVTIECGDTLPTTLATALDICGSVTLTYVDSEEGLCGLVFDGNVVNTAGNSFIPSSGTGGCTPITTFENTVSGLSDGSIVVEVGIDLTHTWDGDLGIFLEAPNGQRIDLSTGNGGTGDNFMNTSFRDDAATSITAGAPPFTGTFRPEGSLAFFCNTVGTISNLAAFAPDQNGTWELIIEDNAGGDIGVMRSWSITFAGEVDPCCSSIRRTHYATDECGNVTVCVQRIDIVDTTPPTITCPANTTIECGEPLPVPLATANDICDDDVFVTLIDERSTSRSDGFCLYYVIRTYRAEDDCGLSSSCTQVITIQDTTPPALTCPDDYTIACEELTCLTFDEIEVDPVDDPVVITPYAAGGVIIDIKAWSKGMVMRMPTLFDTENPGPTDVDLGTPNILYGGPGINSDDANGFEASNNQPRGKAVIVQMPDAMNPFPDDYLLSDSLIFTFSEPVFVVSLVAVDFESPQAASGAGVLLFDENGASLGFTPFTGGEDNNVEDVSLQQAGVKTLKVYYGSVIPTSGGIANLCFVYVPCDTENVLISDACNKVDVNCNQTTTIIDECIMEIVNTYSATDDCDNASASCTQTITVETDTEQPEIQCPADLTLDCNDQVIPAPGVNLVVATDNCSDTVLVTWVADIPISDDPCETSFRRIYRATDECGNSAMCAQFIYIVDRTAPLIVCPEDATIECGDPLPTDLSTATDNCNSFVVTYTDSEAEGSCPMVITRTHYAEDICGNVSSCTQYIYIEDTTPPSIACLFPLFLECGDPIPFTCPVVTDICSAQEWVATISGSISLQDPVMDGYFSNGRCIDGWSEYTGGACSPRAYQTDNVTITESGYYTFTGIFNAGQSFVDGMGGLFAGSFDPNNPCVNFADGSDDSFVPDYSLDPTIIVCELEPGSYTLVTTFFCNSVETDYEWTIERADIGTTFVDSDPAGECPMVITRTHFATDECGNISSCTQYIYIEDTTPPSITCPDDVTLECNVDPIPTDLAAATDICDEDVDVTYVDIEYPQNCDNGVFVDGEDQVLVLIVRTHIATDDCGNSISCTQHIVIRDDTPPMVTCPEDVTIECDQDINDLLLTGAPIVVDLCDPDADATIAITFIFNDDDPCAIIWQRVWQATDHCGNGTSGGLCAQFITIVDTTPPSITCPADTTIECGTGVPITLATATDNCNEILYTYADSDPVGVCPTVITRTHYATDVCGNRSSCTQRIFLVDTTAPEITCPEPVTVECIEDIPLYDVNLVSASDNCDADVAVTFIGDVVIGEDGDCVTVVKRTYKAVDDCDNVTTCTQYITVHDTTPPQITCPPDMTLECDIDVPAVLATALDNCDESVGVTYSDEIFEQDCAVNIFVDGEFKVLALIVRTHYAIDDCGNIASCTQHIVVRDDTPPQVTCPADITIDCAQIPDPELTGWPIVIDNCDPDPVPTYADIPGGSGCNRFITRVWSATDHCGNGLSSNFCLQIITITDTTPPSITCPADASVECGDPLPTTLATGSDFCNNAGIAFSYADADTTEESCELYIVRTHYAADICGNRASCTQRIYLIDTTPPEIVCPPDMTLECDLEVPYVPATATDDCHAVVDITYSDEVIPQECANDVFVDGEKKVLFLIVRTHYATDECGNTASCTQHIVQRDDTPPQVTCPPNITIECTESTHPSTTGWPVLVDNCDPNPQPVWADLPPTGNSCSRSFIRVWTATDHCGNGMSSNICIQTITIRDRTPPSIVCPPDATIECGSPLPTTLATGFDSCNTTTFTYIDSAPEGDCPMVITRTHTARDFCGNTSQCTQYIFIDDTTPPSIECPDDVTLECGVDPLPTEVATATDLCDLDVDVTYSDVEYPQVCANDTLVEGVDQVISLIIRTHIATDDCGNTSSCTQHIIVRDDTPPSISCPADITIQCDQDPDDLDLTGVAVVFDLCDPDANATIILTFVFSQNACTTVLQRVWHATDRCGNGTSAGLCTQFITIVDTEAPQIVCPSDVTVECGDPIPMTCPGAVDNCTELEFLGTVSGELDAQDPVQGGGFYSFGCSDQGCDRYYETSLVIISEPGTYIFTGVFGPDQGFSETDGMGGLFAGVFNPNNPCGNFVAGSDDDNPESFFDPLIITCVLEPGVYTLVSTSWNCANSEMAYTWTIERTEVAFSSVDSEPEGSCPMVITRTHFATDSCGNVSSCLQFIFIEDTTAPEISCPATVTIECGDPLPTTLATATDVCDEVLEYTYVDGAPFNEGACTTIIIRKHFAEDECGNVATCDQVIVIVDTTPPVISCPADATVECGDEVVGAGNATATDVCSESVFVTIVGEETTEGSCFYTIIRTYQAIDECGNASTCTQVITVQDTTPPEVSCPANELLGCFDETCLTFDDIIVAGDSVLVPQIVQGSITIGITAYSKGGVLQDAGLFNTDTPHAGDLDLGTPNVLYGGPGENSDDPDGYEASNNRPLGNIVIVQQPGSSFPDDHFLSDSLIFTFSSPVFMENVVVMDFEVDQILSGAGIFLYDEFGALISFTGFLGDGNDNSMEEVVLKKAGVKTMKLYYGTSIPGSGGIGSMCYVYAPCNAADASATDVCNGSMLTCRDTTIVMDDCITQIVRTYSAEDLCGNVNEDACVQILTLQTDGLQPDIICPADIALPCGEPVPAPDPDAVVATDNCSATEDITVTWVQDIVTGFGCDEEIRRIYQATDECGNVALCVQFITRLGPPIQLSAKVILGGSMTTGASDMYTLINNLLPEDQPYWANPSNYPGPEEVAVFPDNIVDWVLVELRDVITMEPIGKRSALVTSDGDIVDLDGVSPLMFTATPDQYYVVICHRNHLDVLSDAPVDLSGSFGSLDFTLGNAGLIQVGPGMWAMIKGDVNSDGIVNNTDLVLLAPKAAIGYSGQYLEFDVNMDGLVNNTDLVILAPFAAIGYAQGF